jgi:hypothetical protein
MKMLGYKLEEVEEMSKVLNYTIHHYVKGKFADEDNQVLRKLEDLVEGLISEGHVS